jgi:hypothetical protein
VAKAAKENGGEEKRRRKPASAYGGNNGEKRHGINGSRRRGVKMAGDNGDIWRRKRENDETRQHPSISMKRRKERKPAYQRKHGIEKHRRG